MTIIAPESRSDGKQLFNFRWQFVRCTLTMQLIVNTRKVSIILSVGKVKSIIAQVEQCEYRYTR